MAGEKNGLKHHPAPLRPVLRKVGREVEETSLRPKT